MTIELFYLLLSAILTACLWIPFVAGQVMARGMLKPEHYVTPPDSPLPAWVNRANRAHINAIENLVPFTVVVLVAHLTGISNGVTTTCAAVYFVARVLHAIVHITGFKYFMARTLVFNVAWIALIVYAINILKHT